MMKSFSIALALSLVALGARAEVKLAALFSEHAVFQSGVEVPVWGWAAPGETVEVSVAGKSGTATADQTGKWTVKLGQLGVGGPHELLVKSGGKTLLVKDVLVGEVWLGSGQSNMAMAVNRAKEYEAEKAAAALPQVRMFTVGGRAVPQPQADCEGKWVVCSPETVGSFSATAYFFGREIHQALKVPVGLINSSVGGTPIDSWLDAGVQKGSKDLAPMIAEQPAVDLAAMKAGYEKQLAAWTTATKAARKAGQPVPKRPVDPVALRERKGNLGGLFNGKIAPLVPYALRGFLWYQGEANSTPAKAPFYQYQLPLLVTDWRQRWGGKDVPFAWVQLPGFVGRGDGWCLVREAMAKTLRLPNTGMAVTLDIGEAKNIHPANKQEVGKRLSKWALNSVYGQKGAVSGPRYVSHEIIGPHIVVKFSHTDGGLVGREGLQGFVVCGADHHWQPAQARIEGDKLFVFCPSIAKPVAARYAWEEMPPVSLWNGAGFPASPFRTDDFKPEADAEVIRPALPPK